MDRKLEVYIDVEGIEEINTRCDGGWEIISVQLADLVKTDSKYNEYKDGVCWRALMKKEVSCEEYLRWKERGFSVLLEDK